VTFEAVQRWVSELTESGQAGGTVRKNVGVLSSIMRFAVRTRKIGANPVQGVDLPRQALSRRRYLSATEVESLAHAAGTNADVVFVLAYCGLRIGELAALKVGSVNVRRRRLQIDQSVTEVNGVLTWSTPKDHQRRSVPFPEFLVGAIEARCRARERDEVLFPSARGEVLRVRNMRRDWFDAAATTAGLAGLTPHELRHTAASLAVSAGASVLVVQRMLGHEKPSMTLDVYADLFDADLDDVADRLSRVRSEILADSLRTAAR
jgi:integrase